MSEFLVKKKKAKEKERKRKKKTNFLEKENLNILLGRGADKTSSDLLI